jgi:hypothetical protein
MGESNEYLLRCLDVFKADKNVSEETFIIMFTEYAKYKVEEKIKEYKSWRLMTEKPKNVGRYLVMKKSRAVSFANFNGVNWGFITEELLFWANITPPDTL